MDFQDQREAAIGLEVRREGDPCFDLQTIMAGGNLHLFHARHVEIGQYVCIEFGQHFRVLAVHTDDANLARPVCESCHI